MPKSKADIEREITEAGGMANWMAQNYPIAPKPLPERKAHASHDDAAAYADRLAEARTLQSANVVPEIKLGAVENVVLGKRTDYFASEADMPPLDLS